MMKFSMERSLAPMSGITDFAFRRTVRQIHPKVILYSEFTHTSRVEESIKDRLYFESFDSPFIAQIFGNEPAEFGRIAPILEGLGVDGIDINMGCPQKKIANSMHGSGLMKEPELACRIIEATKNNCVIPVSVKTRIGWKNSTSLVSFVKKLETAGLDKIIIHGRTYEQKFKGEADWKPIYELKKQVSIPVIGNGDVQDEKDGIQKVKSLDGYMLGRHSLGNPWVFLPKEQQKNQHLKMKLDKICSHFEYCCQSSPPIKAMRDFRKHLKAYLFQHFPDGKAVFQKLIEVQSLSDFQKALNQLL